MKFLLCAVNAKYIHSNPAVYSLRAYAGEEWKDQIEIAEYTINQYADDILADIYRRRPDIIGFSCYIWNWTLIREILPEIRKLLPQAPVWLGGPEVSFGAEEILRQYPFLAGIMVGEGEETFRELLKYYAQNEKDALCLRQIRGLCLREGYTPARPPLDLNHLPFFYGPMEDFENRIVYYESGRGCPYRCSYCLSSTDKTLRFKDTALVKKELQFFLDKKVAQVKFIDRTFNCSHDHAYAIWSYLAEHDNGVTNFHFEISADLLDERELALLARMRPGLIQLEIGVQSTNPDTICAITRHTDLERLGHAVKTIAGGKNIHQHLDLIAGLPYEDYSRFAESFNWVYGLHPQQLQLGFLKVLKGSPMYDRAEEFGICYQSRPPYEVLYTNWLSYDDILRLKKVEEMVELYYNSNQYRYTLTFLGKAFSSPFAMFEALADFYREKGYWEASPARAFRYQILLSFAEKYDACHREIYRELLALDLYLRENLKSRPDFLKDIRPYREEAGDFYRRAAETGLIQGYEAYDRKQVMRMTHLEPFCFPVWDEALLEDAKEDRRMEPSWYVLFDYHKRDPLTSDAAVITVPRRKNTGEYG